MTDTTIEAGGFCPGCGNFVAVRYAEVHKRRGCTARLDNTFRQFRQQHEGAHTVLDETLKSFDQDIETLFKDHGPGVTLTADLGWTPDSDDDLPDPPPTTPRHPLTDTAPRINPLTGLPE
jgi:hypothetical protein